ncbi:helix-turn-helix domain-containing protein [Magnetospirillum aberrantis]|uniref:Helix-turn-helix transcriptional regulator n=1 Tax=Magnetospirillum aberrantis SpK TaxID=908842 RepID=A0A7C9QV52_9PROT|nr:helix-turn-helix transcriptional regulator [Magnetospirillum aberrantis]NFV80036.1 helix-turn-helix transcriptional regulator [Magnetospirillum aberrantis SpK]
MNATTTRDRTGVDRNGRATDTDKQIGAKIRERRILSGLNQNQLAERVGITYQQLHKYERGHNRVSAGRLHQIAQVLGASISDFFEGVGAAGKDATVAQHHRLILNLVQDVQAMSQDQAEAVARVARIIATAKAA